MGQGCPVPMMPNSGLFGDNGVGIFGTMLLRQEFPSAPFTATFDSTQDGTSIRVTVTGNAAASRPAFTVMDSAGKAVGGVATPTGAISETTFTDADAEPYTLSTTETGTAATLYTVTVMQSGAGGSGTGIGGGMMGGGALGAGLSPVVLRQTFSTTPFHTTFEATAASETLRIVVSGNTGESRLALTVTDPVAMVVASVTDATTNVSQTALATTAAGLYALNVTETGAASTDHALRVMQIGRP